MADFCQECAIDLWGKDTGDLAGLGDGTPLPPNHGWLALCEACGPILVDDNGKRLPPPDIKEGT